MDPLVSILADMLRSALAWEQEHGVQQNSAKINPIKPLTITGVTDKLIPSENIIEGEYHDHQD